MVQLTIWALLFLSSQTLGHLHWRRSDRKDGSVTFLVPMTVTMRAEARILSQEEPQVFNLK